MIEQIALTLLIGLLGGLLFKKLNIPAAFMIGSMVIVAIINVLFGNLYVPRNLKLFAQILSGAYIGQLINHSDLENLPKMRKPVALLLALFTFNMILVGFIFHFVFKFDLVTALLMCLPGGIMDVSLMSIDMGAQADVVASMQTIRLVGMLLILPNWIKFILKRLNATPVQNGSNKTTSNDHKQSHPPIKNDFYVIFISLIGGIIGYYSQLPVGTLIGALIASLLIKLYGGSQPLRPALRYTAQICAGSIIGTTFTHESLLNMFNLIMPAIILLAFYLTLNYFYSIFIYRRGLIDLQSALFSSSPAGATDISLIAGELGGDLAKIASTQIIRMLYTIIVLPNVVKLIIWLASLLS
ncbi:AbrB family transcriptional regulator [Globicatella sanguinis]|uniref:AbrB family transcriptional regulator n=1 Tax=Globicatella sanguinis TaxID=13076 RepID=UPI0008242B3B|nr:AbrB family transcriptional regulator [Globicatella sanguinis]